ncbi:MAG: OmpA family protein [Candidatus Omnitrophica bacterium]|nr:OmpA family protein [Candidatus Omnitrophota bacterium]MDD5430245.1 OmpA family protein [Candidatus Omnitrophota bacterium]
MKKRYLCLLVVLVFAINGCAVIFQKGRSSDIEKIKTLEGQVQDLRSTKSLLEERLSKEINDKQVKLSMAEKGLVITFVAEVLFDSGKAKLRKESYPILNKVVAILQEEVPENNIGVEGYTDNIPIKYSRWNSNWELSAQRALSVLAYLESEGVSPLRLSATGYGEYKPVASNDTVEGRQSNRRVEIVILPRTIKKAEDTIVEIDETDIIEEELK